MKRSANAPRDANRHTPGPDAPHARTGGRRWNAHPVGDRPKTERIGWPMLLLLLAFTAGGCRSRDALETTYGQRLGSAGRSVNGTSVLAGMFREAGLRVATVKTLSSRLDRYQVIVWAPDDFALPSEEVRGFFESWLAKPSDETGESERVLVYIGRDYDAAWDYWQHILMRATPREYIETMRRRARARSEHDRARLDMPRDECCEWFVMRRDFSGHRVDPLQGPWGDRIVEGEAEIWSQGRLDIPSPQDLAKLWKNEPPPVYMQPDYEPLLQSGSETLTYQVSKSAWGDSKILVVANGSYLLNMPLVNHQHRRLAGMLIDRCGMAARVAFLESGAGAPLVVEAPSSKTPDLQVRMRVLLAIHWVVWGLLFCFCVFPIFGRPKSFEAESAADFGQHINALAALLERTGDSRYAQQQLDLYHALPPGSHKAAGAPIHRP